VKIWFRRENKVGKEQESSLPSEKLLFSGFGVTEESVDYLSIDLKQVLEVQREKLKK
jgi:hypothetical protein